MIYYDFQRVSTQKSCVDQLTSTFKDKAAPKATVYHWFCELNRGWSMHTDKLKEGCPKSVVVPQSIDAVREMITLDRHVTYREIRTSQDIRKGTDPQKQPLAKFFKKEITSTLHGSNRNITMGSWFTSVLLADELLASPYNLTLVRKLRNKLFFLYSILRGKRSCEPPVSRGSPQPMDIRKITNESPPVWEEKGHLMEKEQKLRAALLELKASKEMCDCRISERGDHETEIRSVIFMNTNLKGE
ncbi:hypothetical protein EVAR_5554_1 [Eumeta japonica]|uniref:Mos1 transposase HTH domain-containing protein n=1 Tax=Eumeta variegata TaxID=151549 RepID=A0A4C1U237_EUMVA|nr:hypothetical protein EVAR_5554_1 [Eumeta japonica]